MRRRAYCQGGSVSRSFPPKRCYSEGLRDRQEAGAESEAGPENPQHLAQDGVTEKTPKAQQTSLEQENAAIGTRKPSLRRPLPLSPLMDPSCVAAKQKYRLPKARPSRNPTPFQQQLAKNPYAQALATPVRMCQLSRIQLPRFFLQDFEQIAHPTTNEPWIMPRSLTSPKFSPSLDSPQPVGTKRGAVGYALSRFSLIRAMRQRGSGYEGFESRLVTLKEKHLKSSAQRKIGWRGDMDTFVLGLMRRRIVEVLKDLSERKEYLCRCQHWDYAKRSKQMGAFLWLGPECSINHLAADGADGTAVDQAEETTIIGDGNTDAVEIEYGNIEAAETEDADIGAVETELTIAVPDEITALSEGNEIPVGEEREAVQRSSSGNGPGEFATLDLDKATKSKVPVYNLQVLLGDDLIQDLRKHRPQVFNHEIVALKHRRLTIDVQLRLWKLEGYIAEHPAAYDELE